MPFNYTHNLRMSAVSPVPGIERADRAQENCGRFNESARQIQNNEGSHTGDKRSESREESLGGVLLSPMQGG